MAITRLITADELLEMELEPGRYDLIDGELYRMPPAGQEHGDVQANLFLPIGTFVQANSLGRTYSGETGFRLSEDPDVVVAPDVAFVRADRLDLFGRLKGYLPLVPDLAIEVVSPSDYPKLVLQKIEKYMGVGIPLLVIVYPDRRIVQVLGAGRESVELGESDVFDGGDVLPGFRLPVAEIFR